MRVSHNGVKNFKPVTKNIIYLWSSYVTVVKTTGYMMCLIRDLADVLYYSQPVYSARDKICKFCRGLWKSKKTGEQNDNRLAVTSYIVVPFYEPHCDDNINEECKHAIPFQESVGFKVL